MFQFFENLIQPFPPEEPTQPPKELLPFCWHYTRGVAPYLVAMALLTGLLAIIEVSLFGFLGNLVDWLSTKNPETFLEEESSILWRMGLIVLVGLPITVLLHSLVIHQSLLGNYPMIIRWQAHRYLLSQSVSFYQNEWMAYYNNERTHQGKMCCGRTPIETPVDGKNFWAEKNLAQI